ncbi:MAG: cryptochrome/photolyase family protein, partial [Betaproteobacteria bacterium]
RLVIVRPGEERVLAEVRAAAAGLSLPLDVRPDRHFLCSLEEFAAHARGRRQLRQEYFYRELRTRHGVLMDGSRPEAGQWNLDRENRQAFGRKGPGRVPAPRSFRPDACTRGVIELVRKRFREHPGQLEAFDWPVSRQQARAALEDFVRHRLARFGRYQDAMWTGEPFLNHSLLSPALNLKLLSPRECLDAATAAHPRRAHINSVEAFVRQILGWREFIRGVYWHEGLQYGERNALAASGRLPPFYWSGETDMHCLAQAIGQVLEYGYGHHIQRLMVTGNFALLAGVHPRAVSDWYLGMYVDGVDWVTLPNTLGMVMHADGGVVGTKPYAASGKYIQRMSNYCAGCRYDPGKRTGDAACPFNTFYWDFLISHRERFRSNRRMAMMLKHVDRMDPGEMRAIQQAAAKTRQKLGVT